MQDGGGVIHHAEGINRGAELFFMEALTNIIGKARPYEEHLLARPNLEIGLLYINYGPKLH